MSDWRSDVCSSDLACEGRGGLGRGAFWISPNRGHPLPASPCRRRGRGQGKSSRLKPLLQVPGPPTPGGYSFFIACPPNSLRFADRSLLANESPSRERRRALSDWVSTGADPSRSLASATVQGPSPESGTNGAMPSLVGFLSSASAVRSRRPKRPTL